MAKRRFLGLISDTHGLLRDEALAALAGAERIVHAGDVGVPAVLEGLMALAPVTAVRGNNDVGPWARALPERARLRYRGVEVLVVHDRNDLDDEELGRARVVVSGHSHAPRLEERDGVLFVNPGSAGPRRFRLPVAVARLYVDGGAPRAELVVLEVAPGKRPRGGAVRA